MLTAAHCQPGFLASLLVELGEYDISGPNEFMSTKEQKVSIRYKLGPGSQIISHYQVSTIS